MSTERPSSSGFHNIRAMFENTDSSSSPNRPHRLSSGALSNGSRSTSRSAVRSSFVAVEPVKNKPPQQEELNNEMEESTAHRRRGSFSVDQESNPEALADLKKTISEGIEQRRGSLMETVPEVAVVTPAIGREGTQLGESAMAQQEANGSSRKQKQGEKSPLRLSPEKESKSQQSSILPASPSASGKSIDVNSPATPNHEGAQDGTTEKTTSQLESNGMKSTPDPSRSKDSTSPAEKKSATTSRETSKTRDVLSTTKNSARAGPLGKKDNGPPKQDAKTTSSSGRQGGPTRPGTTRASSTSMTSTTKDSPGRNIGLARTRSHVRGGTQPANSSSEAASSQGKTATKAPSQAPKSSAPAKVPAKASNGPTAGVPKDDATGKHKTSSSAETATKARGSAFAPTASSAARTTGGGGSQSRNVSGGSARDKPLQRQPSTRNGGKPATSGAAPSSKTRPPGRQQPAAERNGPPKDPKISKPPTKPANGGFLARMMRPTTSSAQKTHDKPGTVSSKAAPTRKTRPSVDRAKSGPPHGSPSASASKKAHSDAGGQQEPAQEDHSQKGANSADEEPAGEASFAKSNESAVDEPAAISAPESTTENGQEDSMEQPTEEVTAEASAST